MEQVRINPLSLSSCNTTWLCDPSMTELPWQLPVELLARSSASVSTQKCSPHCSFEEEHHQIHPADVSGPSHRHPLHGHADRERWKGWDNAGRPAQRPQEGLLPRSVSPLSITVSLIFCATLVWVRDTRKKMLTEIWPVPSSVLLCPPAPVSPCSSSEQGQQMWMSAQHIKQTKFYGLFKLMLLYELNGKETGQVTFFCLHHGRALVERNMITDIKCLHFF